jgi:hypothetical protein
MRELAFYRRSNEEALQQAYFARRHSQGALKKRRGEKSDI